MGVGICTGKLIEILRWIHRPVWDTGVIYFYRIMFSYKPTCRLAHTRIKVFKLANCEKVSTGDIINNFVSGCFQSQKENRLHILFKSTLYVWIHRPQNVWSLGKESVKLYVSYLILLRNANQSTTHQIQTLKLITFQAITHLITSEYDINLFSYRWPNQLLANWISHIQGMELKWIL